MYYTGFADEAAFDIDGQIKATKELGWTNIESRAVGGTNIHDLSDADFDAVAGKLEDAGIRVNCFGSTVANWSRDPLSDEDWEKSLAELKRALPRMERLGTRMIRGMSFTRYRDASRYTPEVEKIIFDKVTTLAKMCEDAGALYMHENCANYGGMGAGYSLKLVENVKSSAFRLLFDTGNPANSVDYSAGDGSMQDAFEFYRQIKEFVGYVHIKDGRFKGLNPEGVFNNAEWTWPGEGDGRIPEIIKDLLDSGYDGGFSIEPHMQIVFHEDNSESKEELKFQNYVEYGRRFMKIVEAAKG